MGLRTLILQKLAKKAINNDPQMHAVMNKLTESGYYDGSKFSKEKVDECFNILKNNIGVSNPNTENLYMELINSKHYPISLLAAYSFAIGEFIENPIFEPYNLNSEGAQNNYMSFKILLPEFSKFIESRHTGTERVSVTIMVGNLMEYFM